MSTVLDPADAVLSGPLIAAMSVAALAGLVSFASPCVLPLLPGFLGYITGLAPDGKRPRTLVVCTGAFLFVLGFATVFVLEVSAFAFAGDLLGGQQQVVLRLGGVMVIIMGLVFIGLGGQRSWQLRWRPRSGLLGAPLLGMVFATGWAPCTGPTLAAVLTLATTIGDHSAAVRGTALASAYSLGLGLPFILFALGSTRYLRVSRWISAHHHGVQLLGGGMLIAVGALLVSGWWVNLTSYVQTRLVNGFTTVL